MQSAECRLRNVKARNPAFTLIELLVVLAVILVLAGLLLPVLVNARARSVRTQCLSNIKQVDMVFLMYGHDNRDRLPQGGLLTVLPAAIADMAVRDGISHRVFYDPGVVNQVKVGLLSRDITGDWFTNFIAIPDRTQIGEKVQGLAQRNVDARSAAGDSRAGGTLQGDAVAAHGVDGRLVDTLAGFAGAVGAGSEFFPVDLHARGVDNAAGGRRDFGANAFARDDCDFVPHGCIVLYAKGKLLSKGGQRGVARKEPGVVRRK
jgi:prepilin-type N-terminal cleavage/methylation domain-containing protein